MAPGTSRAPCARLAHLGAAMAVVVMCIASGGASARSFTARVWEDALTSAELEAARAQAHELQRQYVDARQHAEAQAESDDTAVPDAEDESEADAQAADPVNPMANRWVPMPDVDAPRPGATNAELIVSRLWHRNVQPLLVELAGGSAVAASSVVGAEWWIQWRREDEGMHWHVDRDEESAAAHRPSGRGRSRSDASRRVGLRQGRRARRRRRLNDHASSVLRSRSGAGTHGNNAALAEGADVDELPESLAAPLGSPLLSSVLYLGDAGRCTVAVHQARDESHMAPSIPSSGSVVCPRSSRYFIFNGSFPHAVVPSPAALDETSGLLSFELPDAPSEFRPTVDDIGKHRITMLINWWQVAPKHGAMLTRSDNNEGLHAATEAAPLGRAGVDGQSAPRSNVVQLAPVATVSDSDPPLESLSGPPGAVVREVVVYENAAPSVGFMPYVLPFPLLGPGAAAELTWSSADLERSAEDTPGIVGAWMLRTRNAMAQPTSAVEPPHTSHDHDATEM